MTGRRGVLVLGVVAVVALLVWWGDGSPAETGAGLQRPAIPAAGEPGAASSTWYCAAGTGGGEGPWRHQILMFDPSGGDATARLTAYGAEGEVDSIEVDVEAPGPVAVNVGDEFATPDVSVLVESSAPELVVEHRVRAEGRADQVPCATSSSRQWSFPAMTTSRGNSAQLVLFNPFSMDASVDITAAISDGVRAPQEWQGLVVPAGTRRVLDLGAAGGIERRDQFSVVVDARNGRLVAETSQTLDTEADEESEEPATSGLRLQVGVPRALTAWTFAGGFAGEGAQEELVVFNPGDDPVTAVVQVVPYGAPELPPEPFEIEVPARRYQQLDLGAESRIPGEGFHSIAVEAERPVVVGRVISLFDGPSTEATDEAPARPSLTGGTAISTGSPLAATLWSSTGVVVVDDRQSSLYVYNPGPGIAVVAATAIGGDADGSVLADEVEVAAGDGVVVATEFADLSDRQLSVLVEANAPVVVESLVPFDGDDDLSFTSAVPLRAGAGGLVGLGE